MKSDKIVILTLVFLTSIFFFSCVEDGDFKVPESLGIEENENLNLLLDSIKNNQLELKSIKDLKSLYLSGSDPLKIVSNIVVKGYVVSSDKTGNFFREFYMQDAPENPTSGIKVALNLNNIYNKYNFGREVYIKLKDLYLGETNSGDGVTTIAGKIKLTDAREVESITLNQQEDHLFRSSITEEIIPKNIPFGGLENVNNIGTFITVENAFFSEELVGKTFVDPNEDFDTKRTINTCQGPSFVSTFIETSSFASFANKALPTESSSINALVTRDFGGDFTVLVLNSDDDILENSSRCEPANLLEYSSILLNQDFEATSGEINILNWTNYKEFGSKSWRAYDDANSLSRAARMSSYRSGDAQNVSWLITEGVNLDTTTEEYLSFETSTSFADGSELEVLISSNWDGLTTSISSATWISLPARIASNNDDYNAFKNSTFIDLSNYSGKIYVAFKYTGNEDDNFDGTYELDNIQIIAK